MYYFVNELLLEHLIPIREQHHTCLTMVGYACDQGFGIIISLVLLLLDHYTDLSLMSNSIGLLCAPWKSSCIATLSARLVT